MVDDNGTQGQASRNIPLEDALSKLRAIRHALLIGLDSFGEVERVIDEYELAEHLRPGMLRKKLCPVHPTGSNETIGQFAEALRFVDIMECEAEAEHG